MIADIGCEYVLVGHSERRTIFGENDEVIAKKITAAYRNNLKPMLCVGENIAEREAGKTNEKIAGQLRADLAGLKAEEAKKLVVAYEPLWAIGSGHAASAADAQEVCLMVRNVLTEMFGKKFPVISASCTAAASRIPMRLNLRLTASTASWWAVPA